MPSLFDQDAFNRSLFFPRGDSTQVPEQARDLHVDVDDARIHVRIHDRSDRALVLLFHGNGEVASDYDPYAEKYAEAGASLAVADFRGYGLSTGIPTFRAALPDAHAVLDAVVADTSLPVFVMGRSLGGACAAELAQQSRRKVAGYIFESTGSDLAALVERRGLFAKTFSDADRTTFDPLPKMARCTTPALILHGRNDEIISFREAEATSRAIPHASFVPIPGRGHNDISRSDVYWTALRDFIAAHR